MKSYDPRAVANQFIRLADHRRQELTPMKLQKLLYFAHGWHLAIYGKPLLRERIEAWRHGPVIESIYHEVKVHGSGPITTYFMDPSSSAPRRASVPKGDRRTLAFIERIWDVYGGFSGPELSQMTHLPDGPWSEAFDISEATSEKVYIPDDQMQGYFKRLGQQRTNDPA